MNTGLRAALATLSSALLWRCDAVYAARMRRTQHTDVAQMRVEAAGRAVDEEMARHRAEWLEAERA